VKFRLFTYIYIRFGKNCNLLPKIDIIELEMSNNDIIHVSETHLSQDIDNEDIQLRGFQTPIRVDRNRHGGGVAIFAKPNNTIFGPGFDSICPINRM
jgi:exonuclease III